MIFILSSISGESEFWSVNHTSTYENSESNVFKNINFSDEISNNWPKDNYYKHYNVLILLQ